MEPETQLTYEMNNPIEDLMKLSNINRASFEMQNEDKSYYSSYREYLNNKFGSQVCQTENNSQLRSPMHMMNSEERQFAFGDRRNIRSIDRDSNIKKSQFDEINHYGNKMNIEVTPYSSRSGFSNVNFMGTNPFYQKKHSNEFYSNEIGSRNGIGKGDGNDDLITASKTNYGRNRVGVNSIIMNDNNTSNNDNNIKKTNDLINSACYKSIPSLQSIKHLPLEDQVALLFNENQTLKGKLDELNHNYFLLQNQYNALKTQKEGEQIDNKNKLNDFLLKNNKELQEKNKETEALLEDLISLANDINQAKGKTDLLLSIDQVKQSPDQLKRMLSIIREEVFDDDTLNDNDKCNKNSKNVLKRLKKEKQKNNKDSSEASKSNNTNSYYPYNSKPDCLPCSLGISNSNKGYSPRMCSPNRDSYSQKENSN